MSGDQARQLVLDALPEGAEVHTGLSETLQQIGITDVLENSGRYDPVRPRLKQLDRETQGRETACRASGIACRRPASRARC